MGGSFKLFHKKDTSNDLIFKFFPLGPCGRSSAAVHETVKQCLIGKGKEETKSMEQEGISHADPTVNPAEELMLMEHPVEPVEIDHPIRCPQPEPGIIHDGRIWKERLQISMRRRGQLPFLSKNEVQRLHQRQHTLSSDHLIFPSASAPEPSITKFLE